MTRQTETANAPPRIIDAVVTGNRRLCREHYALSVAVPGFPESRPGQFVQLSPPADTALDYHGREWEAASTSSVDAAAEERRGDDEWNRGAGPQAGLCSVQSPIIPLLPRAFSIGGLRRRSDVCEIDIIYRVVGTATRWMRSLRTSDITTVLGPLGRPFPISENKPNAILVIGGVGLPPLLWLAESLNRAGKRCVALIGARSADLIPLDMSSTEAPCDQAQSAVACAAEFAANGVPMIVSTDDGSCGFRGTVVEALQRYREATSVDAASTVVYTCGPERMMHATATYCLGNALECVVCMERPMACGMGTCQSCIVTVNAGGDGSRTRYALCCTEGPVFSAEQIVWDG